MRVSKTLRLYIADEVEKRVQAKYQAQLDEERRKEDYVGDMVDACEKAAYDAYFAKAEELKKDFTDVKDKEQCFQYGIHGLNRAINLVYNDPPIRRKISEETADIIRDIIVELELGGDKAKLMELLENI